MESHLRQNPIEKDYHGHSNYPLTFGVLVVLTLVNFGIFMASGGHNLGTGSVVAILGIALVQIFIIITSYMHMRYEPKALWLLPITTTFLVLVYYFSVAPDIYYHKGTTMENHEKASASGHEHP